MGSPAPRSRTYAFVAGVALLAAMSGCTSQRSVEATDGPQGGPPITFAAPGLPASSSNHVTDTTTVDGPVATNNSPLVGLHAAKPGVAVSDEFRSRIATIDPGATDMLAAAAGYDSVITIAVAAEAAQSDAPGRIAAAIPDVTRSGRKCVSFDACRAKALKNSNPDFDGVSGPISMHDNGDPSIGSFSILKFTSNGGLTLTDRVAVQEPESVERPSTPDPLFGPKADGVLRLGTLLPVAGPEGLSAQSALAGIRLAVTEVNQAGGVLGEPVELATDESGSGSPADTAAAAKRLIDQNVDAVIGGTSRTITQAALAPVTDAGRILFSPTDSSPDWATARDRGLFMRVAPIITLEGQVIGSQIVNEGYTKVAIVTTTDALRRSIGDGAALMAASQGATIVMSATLDDAAGVAAIIAQLNATTPQVVVVTSPVAATAELIRQLTKAGSGPEKLPMWTIGANVTPELVAAAGAS